MAPKGLFVYNNMNLICLALKSEISVLLHKLGPYDADPDDHEAMVLMRSIVLLLMMLMVLMRSIVHLLMMLMVLMRSIVHLTTFQWRTD